MARKLITFLGRGVQARDGLRQPYRTARYRFGDSDDAWTSGDVSHFARAVVDYSTYQHQPFEALTVFGTNGSMWDVLVDSFGGDDEQVLKHWEHLVDRVASQTVCTTDLESFANSLAGALGYPVHLGLLPPAIRPEGQAEILEQLIEQIAPGDHVWLDVTNGYRHMPMLGLASAAVSATIKEATIDDIGYGAFEMASDGITPVVSLNWILKLLRVLGAAGDLSRHHQLRPLIDCFPNGTIRNELEKAAYHMDTMRIDQVAAAVKGALQAVDQAVDGLPQELKSVTNLLKTRLEPYTRQQRNVRGLIEMAELALDADDFLRTAIFLSEAIEKAKAEGLPGDPDDDDRLQSVRHWLAHAGQLNQRGRDLRVREMLENRNKLRKFFQQHLTRLRQDLKQS